ncbi:DUF1707 domain-containing protein [Asanoa sp. NPDC049573]|uniref:DUF1707 domain-containing protein n=1 Tax=Asanoa sp. NPDC049573 TaxID=3155396 RepID=UPI003442975F
MNERVGTAQRTHVVNLLTGALEQGYLDLAEYEHRMAGANEAKWLGELLAQLADLPPQFRWDPQQQPIVQQGPDVGLGRPSVVAALIVGGLSIPLSCCFGVGGVAGIAAILLSIRGLRQPETRALAALALAAGTVGVLLSGVFVAIYVSDPSALVPPEQ